MAAEGATEGRGLGKGFAIGPTALSLLPVLFLVSCGPVDHPLGADFEGRHYYASCGTSVPVKRLGEVLDGVVRWVPLWAETEEQAIGGVALEDGFAIHLPKNICGKRAKWVVLFNQDLSNDRVDALVAQFSAT